MSHSLPTASIEKAEGAYPVLLPLKKAVEKFSSNQDYKNKCFSALEIVESDTVVKDISLLAEDLNSVHPSIS